jgi:hypothetical protein
LDFVETLGNTTKRGIRAEVVRDNAVASNRIVASWAYTNVDGFKAVHL